MKVQDSLGEIKKNASIILRHPNYGIVTKDEIEELLTHLTEIRLNIETAKKHKEEIKTLVPRFLLRRWAYASFNQALSEIKKKESLEHINKKRFIFEAKITALWAYQACLIIEVQSFIRTIEKDLAHHTITPHHVQKGDVILSYKTETFLKHEPLSRIIAFATNSPITHSLIAIDDIHPHTFLSANPESKGLGLKNETPRKGELYLVFRLREELSPVPKEFLFERIKHWEHLAKTEKWKYFSFAEAKSWAACFIGFLYLATSYWLTKPICLKNPIHQKRTIFCSEVVDNIFREAGIYLGPRSQEHSVVGPVELFYSPYLQFKGIIVNDGDIKQFKKEVEKKFTLSFLYNQK